MSLFTPILIDRHAVSWASYPMVAKFCRIDLRARAAAINMMDFRYGAINRPRLRSEVNTERMWTLTLFRRQ